MRTGRVLASGQALVELALVAPLLLFLAFGVLAVGRVAQAHMAVSAVADEAAQAAALASSPSEAVLNGLARGQQVANEYGLTGDALALSVDACDFRRGGEVRADASYTVRLDDLPLLAWVRVPATSTHLAPIDAYRGFVTTGMTP